MSSNEPTGGYGADTEAPRDPTLVEDNPIYGHRDEKVSTKDTASNTTYERGTVPPDDKVVERPDSPGGVIGRTFLALLRIAVGFIMFWAFLDKLLGLGYSTPKARAWINGGSPTKGFLSNVSVGPQGLQDFFHNIAGTWWANWLFMIGLAAIGLALILGIGLRIAAIANVVMMAMMWMAEWPLDKVTATGDPSGSSNPIVDYHVVYALAGIVCAAFLAGRTLGFGLLWEKIVGKARWLV